MNENIIKDLENTKFGSNKYYLEIIKEFISKYESPRITINDEEISVKTVDNAGIKEIYFTIKSDNLEIKMNRNINLVKIQDIIVYDNQGIMMERTNAQAELKNDVNEKFKDKAPILIEEFKELGKDFTIYTNQIFKNIRYKKIKRPDNFSLTGLYQSKDISYDERGLMKGKVIEGNFNVLKSNSISTLEFPREEDIIVTKEDIMDDKESEVVYPNSRTL